MRFVLAVFFALGVWAVREAAAGGPCSGVKGGCGRAVYRGQYPELSPAYVGSSSQMTTADDDDDDDKRTMTARRSYRTKARTTARARTWNGTGSAPEETPDTHPGRYVGVDKTAAPQHRPKTATTRPAKFIARFKHQSPKPIVSYTEQGDSYRLILPNGGTSVYPQSMIESFDPVPAEETTQPVAVASLASASAAPTGTVEHTDGLPTTGIVERAVDGDTIRLDGGEVVRLIGIDTPETVHPQKPVEQYGKEASDFARRMLGGQDVRLEYDQANAAIKHRDKYGRLLAYVFRSHDGLDFNAEAVRAGYAHAYTTYPCRRSEEFLGYEREARAKKVGLWADGTVEARGPPASVASQSLAPSKTQTPKTKPAAKTDAVDVFVTKTGTKYHRADCRHLSRSKIPISLEDARARYSPCSTCRPPE
jgi:micrococcal nuclease